MAKKRKSSQSEKSPKTIEDTQLEDVIADEVTLEEDVDTDPVDIEETPAEPDVDVAEEIVPEPDVFEPEPEPEPEFVEPQPEPTPIRPEHVESASNSVLLPAILGGLIAAGLGFAAAYYVIPRANPDLNADVAANTTALSTLREEIAAAASVETQVDLTPVTAEIDSLRDQITGEIDILADRIAVFDERLVTLEKQPSGDGTLQESALQAYQAELDNLRGQVEEQAGEALAQLESTRAEAAAIEQAALDAAQAAQIRTALSQIQSGLNDGAPMDAALTDLEAALGEPVPDALAAVAEGAPTLAKLQADFPNAARAALSSARSGGESGEQTSAFGSFLREQLNVRSVAPRDGDDADAILSRAQAAVSAGQLQTALDEVAALPDVASAQLSEWTAIAETRVAAVNAADEISLSLNVN